jgi:putative hydrolase of the HAD superfamily
LAASEYDGNWMSELLAEHGHRLVDGADRRFASDAWDGEEHHEHSVDEATYRAWMHARWRQLLDACAVPADAHDSLIEAIEARRAAWKVVAYPEVPGVLRELRDRGHRLVVCSNWDWDLDRHLVDSGVADLFDERVSSAWVGARKPHPRIFLAAAASVGAGPDEAVMVGDNWRVDIVGALAVGMRAVHVWRHDASPGEWLPEPPPDADGVPRVRDLRPLPDLLAG